MWELILVSILLSIIIYKFLDKSTYWSSRGFPTLKTHVPLLDLVTGKKTAREFDQAHYDELEDRSYGGTLEFGTPTLVVKDLELVRHILVKDFDHFVDRRDFGGADPLFSKSMFFISGQLWRDVRSIASPTFTSGKLKRMFHHFVRSSGHVKEFISDAPKQGLGHEVNVSEAMRRFTIEVIGAAVFGLDVNVFKDKNSLFYRMSEELSKITTKRKIRFLFLNMLPKLTRFLGMRAFEAEVGDYFYNILKTVFKDREEGNKKGQEKADDFVQILIEAKNSNGNGVDWSEELLVGQASTFLAAGFDSVANNLALDLYALAKYPEEQEKVRIEAEAVLKDGELDYDTVGKLEYLDMFCSEVLRLYPEVSRIERECTKDYEIPGSKKHIISKGTMISIVAEAIHRDEKYYKDPERFDPSRFSQEGKSSRHSYCYLGFGQGPRACIGMRFAQVEIKAVLAQIVKNFEVAFPVGVGKEESEYIVRDLIGFRARQNTKLLFKPRN